MDAWTRGIKGWAAEQRAADLSETTIRLWRSWLLRFATTHPDPYAVTRLDIIEWLAGHTWQPATRRSARQALRSFYTWAAAAGVVAEDPAARLPKVRVPRGRPRPAPDTVIAEAMARATARVRLMLMLAAFCGLRRGEISRVHTGDLDGQTLRVKGKGRVQRDVPVPGALARRIAQAPEGWLFPGPAGHLTPGYVGKLLSRALPGRWTAHTLRHAAATAWADEGLDLHELAELLGHESVRTTQIYTAVRPRRLAAGVEAAASRFTAPPAAAAS